MKVYLIADTHFNHSRIATYCDRPADFTEQLIHNWQMTVRPEDLVFHLGDVIIGSRQPLLDIMQSLPGRKTLIRGNHDRQHSNLWWMQHGFDFSCDGLKFRNCWLSHEPSQALPAGCQLNIHGHLHNIWHGFLPDGQKATQLYNPWQRLFAVEYTDYRPVEFDKFVSHPDRYLARGVAELVQGA